MLPVARYLKSSHILLGLKSGHLDEIDPEKDSASERQRLKRGVIEELADLFASVTFSPEPAILYPNITNRNGFAQRFHAAENKHSSAIGNGLAIPHVRSPDTRSLTLVIARSREGVWFDPPDGQPTHLFFGIAAPNWKDHDDAYLSFYRWIGTIFRNHGEWLPQALLDAETADEMISLLIKL